MICQNFPRDGIQFWRRLRTIRHPIKTLVSDALPRDAGHEAVKPLQGVPLHVALIQAKRELVHVAVQVLVAGVVIDAGAGRA